ncbi:MFS transporter, partial [Raphidocelis subcapitata]
MPRAAERALEVVEGNGHIGDAKAADMAAPPPGPQTEEAAELDRIYRKVTLAILPLFVVTTALSMIDRNNLSYAAISLMPALGLKPTAYGLGSSLFYVTYILFIVPAALLVPHVGARRMLAVMLVAWGAVATCMAFVRSEGAFYALRLLLGLCESGAIPVQWAHIMAFFPKTRVVRPFSYLYIGIALSGILGAPLATGLLALDGRAGLRGYQ